MKPEWDAACEAFEREMWPNGPASGSGSGIWATHKDRLRGAAQGRLSITRQAPITPELWRDAYARIAGQYAVFLERYDLAEDAQAEDIIAAIEAEATAAAEQRLRPSAEPAGLRDAAMAVVFAATKHTPEIIALNRALALLPTQASDSKEPKET